MVLKWRLPFNSLKCESSFFSLDPYRSRIQPSLYILNTPLNFNPHPIFFFGVTFDRILSFKHYILFLRKKFHSRFRDFRSIASASWGPLKNLYVPYIKPSFAPSLPMLTQAGFPSHLCRGCIGFPAE